MKKTIIAGVAGAAIAGAISLGAATAQAAPCSYFGSDPDNGICGAPSIAGSILNAGQNMKNNFSASQAAANAKNNFSPSNAASNLQHALTHGVGSEDQNAP
jgi:hypothetical protein